MRDGRHKIGEKVREISPVFVIVFVEEREEEHEGGSSKVGCVADDEDGDQADQYVDHSSIPGYKNQTLFSKLCVVGHKDGHQYVGHGSIPDHKNQTFHLSRKGLSSNFVLSENYMT